MFKDIVLGGDSLTETIYIEKEYKSKIICQNCKKNIPSVKICKRNPLNIMINCYNCGNLSKRSFEDMKNDSYEGNPSQKMEFCANHKNLKNKFFCFVCGINFCGKCTDAHSSHTEKIFPLETLPQKDFFDKKISDEKKKYLEQIKNYEEICLKNLEDKIKKIKEKFKENKDINMKLFEFVEFLNYNYDPAIYQSYKNIENFTKFTTPPILSSTTEDILRGIRSFFVVPTFYEEDFKKKMKGLKKIKTFGDGQKPFWSLCLTKDGRLASSQDKLIKVFNLQNNKCDITIEAHSENVFYVSLLSNGCLVSCSADKLIKIWEIEDNTYKCLQTLSGHTSFVNKVSEISHGRICSCSDDSTLMIWEGAPPYNHIKTLNRHKSIVLTFLETKKKKLLVSSSSHDSMICIWETTNYRLYYSFKDSMGSGAYSLLEVNDDYMLIGYKNNSVCVLDMRDWKFIKEIQFSFTGGIMYIAQTSKNTVLCGGESGMIVPIFTMINEGVNIGNYIHKKRITSLLPLNDQELVSSSLDGLIHIWTYESLEKVCI